MQFYSTYRIPKVNDSGTSAEDEYLQVNSAGYFEFDEGRTIRHRKYGRNDYLMVYVHDGKGIVKSNGINHEIQKGTIFVYRPGEEQYYGQIQDQLIKCYWVHFTGYGVPELFTKINFNTGNTFYVGVNNEVPALINMIVDEIQIKKENFEMLSTSFLLQLFSILSRKHILHKNNLDDQSTRLNLVINYIHINYSKKITISQLAALTGLCINRFINIFKIHTGVTPKKYLINFRLIKACELLTDTNLSIGQISYLIGIDDQLYFCRLFKKYKNMSPSDYRSKS
ncbi:AraC family transcriptional regulator [Clostridium sediminicola]|uniref:AraC family transcriptional regulator n=1 Tax=Clostridium sediminicola TaxID=3114879 RepID=UPI0031F26A9E